MQGANLPNWWDDEKFNLTGQTFHKLTVLKEVTKNGKGHIRWLCECSCGKLTEVSSNNLKCGRVASCGCALKGCNRKRPYEWIYNTLLSVNKSNCPMSYEDFVTFTVTKHCHYCDNTVMWEPFSYSGNKGHTRAYNLDRKDNNVGYTKDNCVVCCFSCNKAKSNQFTYEQFLQLGAVIRTFRQ
jgi:hypothetical protein